MFSIDWWVGLLVGILLSAFLTPIVEAFLPIDIRFRLHYFKKWLLKQVSRPNVRVGITIKTPDISDQQLDPDKVVDDLKQIIVSRNLQPKATQDAIHFQFEVGKTTVEGILRVVIAPKGKVLSVSQIEAQVLGVVSYHGFVNGVHEVTEASHIMEDYLRTFVPSSLPERALECKLKSLYELTGILSEYKVEQLSASMDNDGYRFDLVKDGIVVYAQRVIDSKIISFVQKLLTVYY